MTSLNPTKRDSRCWLVRSPSRHRKNCPRMLKKRNIKHSVLNAKFHEKEARDRYPMPGEIGAVTIATNMAGRGTDIVLEEGRLRNLED